MQTNVSVTPVMRPRHLNVAGALSFTTCREWHRNVCRCIRLIDELGPHGEPDRPRVVSTVLPLPRCRPRRHVSRTAASTSGPPGGHPVARLPQAHPR